jgi:hypothetical protein
LNKTKKKEKANKEKNKGKNRLGKIASMMAVIHQVALGWISSEPPKIEHFHVQNSEFINLADQKDHLVTLHFHKRL